MRCRICGDGEAVSLGVLPDCREFAKQQIEPPIMGGELWRCQECGSMFRYPTLSADQYLDLYQAAPGGVWEGGESQRNDIAAIYAYLEHHGGGSVLDIGCHAGGFLAGLPDRFSRHGLEPSELAAASARKKSVRILGKKLEDLDSGQTFDVVTAIDVIEHVPDVEGFLVKALVHVAEGGLLIITSGNPDCIYWKSVFKARYWYSSYPEHLVFPSFRYFRIFAARAGLAEPRQDRFKYVRLRPVAALLGFVHQLAYAFIPDMYFACLRMKQSGETRGAPETAAIPFGGAGIFTDHHLIVFRQRGHGQGHEIPVKQP